MTTHDNAPPPDDWRPEPRVPSFHNTCTIEVRSVAAAWCEGHGVRVYRDGVDWCTKPEPHPGQPHRQEWHRDAVLTTVDVDVAGIVQISEAAIEQLLLDAGWTRLDGEDR